MNRRTILAGAGGAALLGATGFVGWRSAVGSFDDYASYISRLRAPLGSDPPISELVRYATLAANSHNTQPWMFGIEPDGIRVVPDLSRATPVVDPDDHHLFVSLGCVAENLAIAAAATGRVGELEVHPEGVVRYAHRIGPARSDPLFAAIPQRQSTRAEYDSRPVDVAQIDALRRAAEAPGVHVAIITKRAQIDRVRDLVVAANGAQIADPAFLAELKAWLRFNPRSAIEHGDGLYAPSSGNPILPTFIGRRAFDLAFTADAENEKYARHIDSSAGVAVLFAEREDKAHWIAVGRALQRFALTATSLGLKHAYINQPVEISRFRPEIAELVGHPGKRPDIILRFGFGPTMPYSPRRNAVSLLRA